MESSTKSPFTSACARPSPTRSSPDKYSDGDPLPSVRAFAAEQQANPLTVAKAYQGFQDEGLIIVKRGVGMFVAPGARARLRESERNRFSQGGMARDPRAHEAARDRPRAPDRPRERLNYSCVTRGIR